MTLALGGSWGVAFLVAAAAVMEALAFACSSPQTAEINIRKREKTLMKWVHMGQGLAALLIIIAAIVDARARGPILFGGALTMTVAEGMYLYAKKSGMANGGAETEEY